MAAQTSAALQRPRAERLTPEEAARRALAGAQPSLAEILSLWPAERRLRIVLWVKLGEAGTIVIGAHPREQPIAGAAPEVKRLVRRIRADVPVVLELPDGGTVVVPLRVLGEAAGAR